MNSMNIYIYSLSDFIYNLMQHFLILGNDNDKVMSLLADKNVQSVIKQEAKGNQTKLKKKGCPFRLQLIF